jgi:hypothetical protein
LIVIFTESHHRSSFGYTYDGEDDNNAMSNFDNPALGHMNESYSRTGLDRGHVRVWV